MMSDERDIQQVIAKYVRAVDRRDGVALAELFIPNGKVTIFYTNGGKEELIVELAGREVIGDAMSKLMKPHSALGWSRHTTFDTIIEVDGERATIDAQFIVYNVVGAEKPAAGWPESTLGIQGTITPIESGYYRSTLGRNNDGSWRIAEHRIDHDMPFATPGK
jgi:hypothetical protein